MAKTDTLAIAAVEAKKMGMSYGQYTTYLTCHKDEAIRKKSPYTPIMERAGEPIKIKIGTD